MSANDNAMTRFLFAILQQKCLKDIDWNKVAHDPILAQEITNGHAARMRYSRFKAAMLGLEPQRRNRTNPNRSRVTKKKKDDSKTKKGGPAPDDDDKSDTDTTNPIKRERHTTEGPDSILSPKVKEERLFMAGAPSPLDPPSQQQPPPTFSTSHPNPSTMSDIQSRMHMRLLTPCSDSDVLAATQGFAHSPASDMLHSDAASFDFCREPTGHHHHHGADPVASQWHHQNPYSSPFGLGVNMGYGGPADEDCFGGSAFCDHQDHGHGHHNHHHHHGGIVVPAELGVHNALMEHQHHHSGQAQAQSLGQQQVVVKHEEWDAREQGHGYH